MADSDNSLDNEFIPSNETRLYLEQRDDNESQVGAYLFGSGIGLTGAFEGIDKRKSEPMTSEKTSTHTRLEGISPTQKQRSMYDERKESLVNLDLVQNQMEEITLKQEMEGETDDKIVTMLCGHADGFEILSKRVKETLHSTKDVSSFLKKRAQIEESYSLEMQKLCQSYGISEGKKGSYGEMWQELLKMHGHISKQREKFAQNLNEMAENIEVLHRNTARGRKQLKEASNKLARELNAAATQLETCRAKFELTSEDWEKTQGNEVRKPKPQQAGQKLNAFQNLRVKLTHDLKFAPKSEEEARTRAALASENYKVALQRANGLRKDYYGRHLPRFVRVPFLMRD